MKRRATIASVIILVALALSGCNSTLKTADGEGSVNDETTYTLKDGRTVTCIYGPARLSCDWANARAPR